MTQSEHARIALRTLDGHAQAKRDNQALLYIILLHGIFDPAERRSLREYYAERRGHYGD